MPNPTPHKAAAGLPEPIQTDIMQDPAWLEACARLNFSPSLSGDSCSQDTWENRHERFEQLERESRAKREQLEKALEWLLAVIAHNPDKVRQALGLAEDCECLAPIVKPWYRP